MITINFYLTQDDDGDEKAIITVAGKTVDFASLSADELGQLVKEALEAPIGG